MAGGNSLGNIQKESMKLLQTVLSCPVGAKISVYDCHGGKSYSKLLALKRWAFIKYITSIMINPSRKEKELFEKCVEMEAEVNISEFVI